MAPALAPSIVRAQAAMKLPLATVWPDANFHVINCRRFADEVKKATGGAIDIDVKSGGQLGFKGPECLRAVRPRHVRRRRRRHRLRRLPARHHHAAAAAGRPRRRRRRRLPRAP
ncbi:MAG: hypothetical protein WCP68_02565, partial [Enhydrobacter sp.]